MELQEPEISFLVWPLNLRGKNLKIVCRKRDSVKKEGREKENCEIAKFDCYSKSKGFTQHLNIGELLM